MDDPKGRGLREVRWNSPMRILINVGPIWDVIKYNGFAYTRVGSAVLISQSKSSLIES